MFWGMPRKLCPLKVTKKLFCYPWMLYQEHYSLSQNVHNFEIFKGYTFKNPEKAKNHETRPQSKLQKYLMGKGAWQKPGKTLPYGSTSLQINWTTLTLIGQLENCKKKNGAAHMSQSSAKPTTDCMQAIAKNLTERPQFYFLL